MKLIFTIVDHGYALHFQDGDVIKTSYVLEVPNESLPMKVRKFVTDPEWRCHQNITVSMVDEWSEQETGEEPVEEKDFLRP